MDLGYFFVFASNSSLSLIGSALLTNFSRRVQRHFLPSAISVYVTVTVAVAIAIVIIATDSAMLTGTHTRSIPLIRQIRSLLYDQGFTIGGARQRLSGEEQKGDATQYKQLIHQMIAELEDVLGVLKD